MPDEIDQTLEIGSRSRSAHGSPIGLAPRRSTNRRGLKEIRAGIIHLVAENDRGNLYLSPGRQDGLGLGSTALVWNRDTTDRAVGNAKRKIDFNGEIDVAGGYSR